MALTHTTAVRNAHVDTVLSSLNGGKIKIYDNANVLLATFTLPNPLAPAAASGSATANSIGPATAVASGTAVRFEATTSGDLLKFGGTVSIADGDGDLALNTTTILLNQQISIDSFVYTAFP
ncbi:hypothetical protein [Pseudanabaena sp. PCC 6802]|uniref:hypothetical protein n=1 Tax=Pseudanabaena sp. PCC 6802 TaxID=118173 RepID=UPI0003478B7F|nr:hypothetical protein [Pseudanabaena sp. PCC 6802]